MKSLFKIVSVALLIIVSADVNAEDGKGLALKYGCFACHATNEGVIGPSFKAIAERYKGDTGAKSTLIAKLKNGGTGVWGRKLQPKYKDEIKNEQDYSVLINWVLSQ